MTELLEKEIEKAIVPAITKDELIHQVERMVSVEHFDYMEAVLAVTREHELEPEDVAPLITGSLKDKLEIEARKLNNLPRFNTATLE